MHTARHCRDEHWQPTIWSREMLRPWMDAGSQLDVDKAREFACLVQQRAVEPVGMSEDVERDLKSVIEDARRALVRV